MVSDKPKGTLGAWIAEDVFHFIDKKISLIYQEKVKRQQYHQKDYPGCRIKITFYFHQSCGSQYADDGTKKCKCILPPADLHERALTEDEAHPRK